RAVTPSVSCTLLASSERATNWPPAEWPATTIAARLGNVFLLASFRRISSTKSNDVRSLFTGDTPPERQLSPPQLQLTSFVSSASRQLPSADAIRGAITIESSSAPARNAAVVAVRK